MPAPTTWRPTGCRRVPFDHPVLPSRSAFRRAHADLESSNEVDLAYAPCSRASGWRSHPSGPTSGTQGRAYRKVTRYHRKAASVLGDVCRLLSAVRS